MSIRPRHLKRFLRSPAVITAEIAVIALAGVLGAMAPQGTPWGEIGSGLGLDHVFHSGWFPCVVALVSLSLSVVTFDQVRRLGRVWPKEGLAAAGAPVLHIGLLLVIGAGTVRALFSSGAIVDLIEGVILQPADAAWSAQQPGPLAQPIRLAHPITVATVDATRYRSGDLRQLAVELDVSNPGENSARHEHVPVNGSVTVAGVRLFVGSDYGPAALVEWQAATGATAKTAALLKNANGSRFEGAVDGPDGARAYVRTEVAPDGARPGQAEIRVMKGSALAFVGVTRIGEAIALPNGAGTLALRGMPFWVRLHASRDPSVGLMYAGFALVTFGLALFFGFTRRGERPAVAIGSLPRPVILVALMGIAGLTGCRGVSRTEARQLVERYNGAVAEAYRRGDIKLVDGVVGPQEGRKLTGLIGVRLDAGLTLDSTLLSLDVLDAARVGDELQVSTRERWRYGERRIGTGQWVAEPIEDGYAMRYHFKRFDGVWRVDQIEFAEPPVSRQPTFGVTGHGLTSMSPGDAKSGKEPAL